MIALFIIIIYIGIFFIDLLPNMKKQGSKTYKVVYIAIFSFTMVILILQSIGINLLKPHVLLEPFLV